MWKAKIKKIIKYVTSKIGYTYFIDGKTLVDSNGYFI